MMQCLQSWPGTTSPLYTAKHKKAEWLAEQQLLLVDAGRTFNLVELGQMCSVHSFVSEHSVYGKVLGWLEALLS